MKALNERVIFITEQKMTAEYKEKVAKLSEEINALVDSKAKDSVLIFY